MTRRIAACDLGKATAKFVTATLENGQVTFDTVDQEAHEGDPVGAFAKWYQERRVAECTGLGAEYGVQITSPNYVLDPKDANVVPREKWYAAPARPPAADSPAR